MSGEAPASAPTDLSPEAAAAAERRSLRWKWFKRVGRVLLFVGGVTALVLLVRGAGPEHVLATLLEAGVFLPLIMLLEVGFATMDVVALRGLLGERGRRVPIAVFVRTALVAYGVMTLLPAGRAGGEVARAAGLAPYVGGPRAVAAGTRLQAATLLGNTTISVPCWIAVAMVSGAHSPLGWAILVNAALTGVVGSLMILISRRSRFGGWLGRRISMLASHGASFDEALRDQTPWSPAIFATTIGRVLQSLQYGIILLAVGGSLTIVSAFVAQGIHLVGAGMGDMVPNQVGITEGAYALFAPALGLEDNAARAIGIALVARICQFSLAGVCLVVSSVWKAPPIASAESDPARAAIP